MEVLRHTAMVVPAVTSNHSCPGNYPYHRSSGEGIYYHGGRVTPGECEPEESSPLCGCNLGSDVKVCEVNTVIPWFCHLGLV